MYVYVLLLLLLLLLSMLSWGWILALLTMLMIPKVQNGVEVRYLHSARFILILILFRDIMDIWTMNYINKLNIAVIFAVGSLLLFANILFQCVQKAEGIYNGINILLLRLAHTEKILKCY